ncbi:MAG: methyltransferase [Betaproteobacteria bacterium]|nr:methyltransferase [Betaproteobacteria bacterium]
MVDMGSGKAYLSFALYDYFNHHLKIPTEVVGVDHNQTLVDGSNALARELGYGGLRFDCATVEASEIGGVDLLIALHACDTATDAALFKGISAGAAAIMAVPCCQKELRPQFRAPADEQALLKHDTFKDRYAIGTVNSINWARVLAQVVYYFKGYFAATKAMTEPEPSGEEPMSQRPPRVQEVSFCVPSGNFGNILAGHIARQMGLPIRRLVLATNENNVLDEFFRTGRYRPRLSQETRQTSSPSMDISKASNFERFMFDLLDRDPVQTRGLWAQIDQQGYFDLSDDPRWQQQVARFGLVSGSSSHRLRIDTIREVYQRFEELIDPHTADGVAVSQAFIEAGVPMICLETAQPAKFADTMVEALGVAPPVPAGFQHLQQSAQRFCRMPKDLAVLKAYIRRHAPAR